MTHSVNDPAQLAEHRDHRCRASKAEIIAALTGNYRPEHVFVLQQNLELFDACQAQLPPVTSRSRRRCMHCRIGKPQAITATARKLAVLVYRALKGELVYRDPGADAYDAQQRTRILRSSTNALKPSALPPSAAGPVRSSRGSFFGGGNNILTLNEAAGVLARPDVPEGDIAL